MDHYISIRDQTIEWKEHKHIASMIMHRTLDQQEALSKEPTIREKIVEESDDNPILVWRGDWLEQLGNVIQYLKNTLTKIQAKPPRV